MPSSVYISSQPLSLCLSMGRSNRGYQTTAHLDSSSHKGLRICRPFLGGEALVSDLDSFQLEKYRCWLLQYMDNLVLAAETKENAGKGQKHCSNC